MSKQNRARLAPWIAGLAVIALVALIAVPSLAAPTGTKYYQFVVAPQTTDGVVKVTITNTSPRASSSNISSVAVNVPSRYTNPSVTIDASSSNGDNSGATKGVNNTTDCTVATTGQHVFACNIANIKSMKNIVLNITSTVDRSGIPCGGSETQDWTIQANTGAFLNGDEFTQDPDRPSTAETSISQSCNGSIDGRVWRDHDGDGEIDTDTEDGQNLWTVKLLDGNGGVLATTQTATVGGVAGKYAFSDLPAGTYTVCEYAPAESPSYLGWTQSKPSANTLCSGGAEPSGYSVTLATSSSTATGKDFGNVRTITIPGNTVTVTCNPAPGPSGDVYTVGNGTTEPLASVTIYADGCKPGEYIFESWVDTNGEQQVVFHPNFPPTGTIKAITQDFRWVIDGDKTQRELWYDDGIQGVPEREMLFCRIDANGKYLGMPAPVGGDTKAHTTCLMRTTETATQSGVLRLDTTVTLVDGRTLLKP